ncbi:restriction endonuclease subunit S [Epilithonimonas lactis]|uniref:restriction endonuclease subunit S n=1 Tax=Epilithonimonas lactis TaxID=421072 RepID=UPI0008BE1479|nr:restriction endonuclease subunit S [Epilithonimonas lactis]SEQ78318.1 type I restriction enzyme, S subunit [Epilithonimonas lactis]
MSYRKLGDLVKFISNKNTDGNATILFGINIDKFFMPSVANIIGVDLKKYKVVKKYQFACNRMHVGRDERLPISMSTFDYDFIVSPAYDVFEVISSNVLPEYLMLWFRRKEFDRQCWFYTDADVRGGLHLDALKSIEIKVPSIEEQRQIVAQYQSIANKIKVNEQICEKLEATAQALYKNWFVDFEFPNEEGKPYKSSGGQMVWNEELGKEIPEGWEVGTIGDLVDTQYGFTDSAHPSKGTAKFLRITDIVGNYIKWDDVPYCNILTKDIYKYSVEFGDFLISRTGANVGYGKMIGKHTPLAVFASFLVRLKPKSTVYISYLYCLIISKFYKDFVLSNSEGSAQPQANANILTKMDCLVATSEEYEKFNEEILPVVHFKEILDIQTQKLTQLQSLLLSRLAVGEEVSA